LEDWWHRWHTYKKNGFSALPFPKQRKNVLDSPFPQPKMKNDPDANAIPLTRAASKAICYQFWC